MITVLARLRVQSWERFKAVHDSPQQLLSRREGGNVTHRVLNQLDDPTDVVYLDSWSSPQDSDDFYHSDAFERTMSEMGAQLMELIKLEETDAGAIDQ